MRRPAAGTIASLALACVLGATMLLSLAAGALIYRRVAERVETGALERVGLSYITAKIHGCDASGAVYAGEFGGHDAVYLLRDIGGMTYETILYVHDGYLRELLCEQGWELEPQDGQTVTEARDLTVAEAADGLLRLSYTDGAGNTRAADVYLRSGA